MVDADGNITEGSSNNAYIITHDGKLITRHLSNAILHGITRVSVVELVENSDLELVQRPFSVEEAENAMEAFSSSASSFVMPVVSINGKTIADGKPGANTNKLRALCIEKAAQSAQSSQALRPRRAVKGRSA